MPVTDMAATDTTAMDLVAMGSAIMGSAVMDLEAMEEATISEPSICWARQAQRHERLLFRYVCQFVDVVGILRAFEKSDDHPIRAGHLSQSTHLVDGLNV
jgi:hypothetical protein